jgi:Fe-S cluster biosynthesis and repair protein YggX
MTRTVKCRKLGQELPGLPFKPFEDELGQKIYEEVSMQAWQEWLQHSVRFINTYRLDLSDKSAQDFLRKQMAIFFGFESGEEAQTAWTPPQK